MLDINVMLRLQLRGQMLRFADSIQRAAAPVVGRRQRSALSAKMNAQIVIPTTADITTVRHVS